ncbi:MAG: ribosome biogenesis factor YjgA [Spongiibacteraceae bacterium]
MRHSPPDEDPRIDDFDERPSKSARKREMHALQDLGTALVELPDGDLKTIPIEGELAAAIAIARRIKDFTGKRRQLQFIGKLMRKLDTTAIEAAYNDLQHGQQQRNKHFHQLEQLRDQLLAEGVDAMAAVLAIYPHADRQHLRQLILAAEKEHKAGQPPAAARKLFKYLRALSEQESSEQETPDFDPD